MWKNRLVTARIILLIGTLTAFTGLAGYWLWPRPDTTELSTVHAQLLGVSAEDFHLSAVIAGRDTLYSYSSAEPVYAQNGQIICWRPNGTRSVQGVNTDTMIYAGLRNNELTLISIPRDLFISEGSVRKLNTRIAAGPEALKNEIANILGVPVDHYVIVNLEIMKNLVDALDGVEIDVPQRMYYSDCTGGLTVDLQPGLQVLNGEQAAGFARFRQLPRGDIDRIENIKLLAISTLRRVQELNVAAVTRLPAIISTFMADVETDLVPSDMTAMLPRVTDVRIGTLATLPTQQEFRESDSGLVVDGLITDPLATERFLATVFGGQAREFASLPEGELVVTDRSGMDGVLDWYLGRLLAFGVSEEQLVVREAEPDLTPTRLIATIEGFDEASFFADLLNTGVQQVNRIGPVEGAVRQFELVLGADALGRTALPGPALTDLPPASTGTADTGTGTAN